MGRTQAKLTVSLFGGVNSPAVPSWHSDPVLPERALSAADNLSNQENGGQVQAIEAVFVGMGRSLDITSGARGNGSRSLCSAMP